MNKPRGVNEENLERVFTYQTPTPEMIPKFQAVRDALIYASKVILENVPECADRSVALRKLREARMDANAAISLNGEI